MLEAPIFIGGAGRSGTTLLRVILDSHPSIACGTEFKLLPELAKFWSTGIQLQGTLQQYQLTPDLWSKAHAGFISELLGHFQKASGKRRIAEKSPHNVFYFYQLFKIFPDARLIQMVRDGRDVVSSLLRMNWTDPVSGEEQAIVNSPEAGAKYWTNAVHAGLDVANRIPSQNLYTMHYEKLVADPETELRTLFSFLDEYWDDQVLAFYQKDHILDNEGIAKEVSQNFYQSSVGRWQRDLSEDVLDKILPILTPFLKKLGYLD